MLFLPTAWTHETGLPLETGIPGFWDSTFPVSCRTGEHTVHSSTPEYGSKEPVSFAGCYTRTFGITDGPKGPECGSRLGTELTGQDFEDPGACLRHCAKGRACRSAGHAGYVLYLHLFSDASCSSLLHLTYRFGLRG